MVQFSESDGINYICIDVILFDLSNVFLDMHTHRLKAAYVVTCITLSIFNIKQSYLSLTNKNNHNLTK